MLFLILSPQDLKMLVQPISVQPIRLLNPCVKRNPGERGDCQTRCGLRRRYSVVQVLEERSKRQDGSGKTRGRFSLAFLLIYALYTCILVQNYTKSERKGKQCVLSVSVSVRVKCVLRAIQLVLSKPKFPDPR